MDDEEVLSEIVDDKVDSDSIEPLQVRIVKDKEVVQEDGVEDEMYEDLDITQVEIDEE